MIGRLLLVLAVITTTEGHSNYVPVEACVDMFPSGHQSEAQTNESPYIISVSSTTYTRNSGIKIFVNATGAHSIDFFEGILLQVRHAVGCNHRDVHKQVGTFKLENGEDFLSLMKCTKAEDTIAHKAHAHIYNRTFTWIPPSDLTGPVYVKATIARRQKTFWTNVHSEFILDPSNKGIQPTTCAGTSPRLTVLVLMILPLLVFLS